jgi:hypothetical protein
MSFCFTSLYPSVLSGYRHPQLTFLCPTHLFTCNYHEQLQITYECRGGPVACCISQGGAGGDAGRGQCSTLFHVLLPAPPTNYCRISCDGVLAEVELFFAHFLVAFPATRLRFLSPKNPNLRGLDCPSERRYCLMLETATVLDCTVTHFRSPRRLFVSLHSSPFRICFGGSVAMPTVTCTVVVITITTINDVFNKNIISLADIFVYTCVFVCTYVSMYYIYIYIYMRIIFQLSPFLRPSLL